MFEDKPLSRVFFSRPAETVAPELLGTILVRDYEGERLAGRITEVEAYLGLNDEASHAYKGMTKRTEVIFGEAGHLYIYRLHGHHCMDIVTDAQGVPGSVLIRAIEPIESIETMMRLRDKTSLAGLADGPGKLCQALAITIIDNGRDVTARNSSVKIIVGEPVYRILRSPRIGVSEAPDKLLRFTIT